MVQREGRENLAIGYSLNSGGVSCGHASTNLSRIRLYERHVRLATLANRERCAMEVLMVGYRARPQ